MADGKIQPDKVKSPIQLLAACLIFVGIVESAFMTGAEEAHDPKWAPGLFVVASVVIPFVIVAIIFRLYTKYRAELLGDKEYLKLAEKADSEAKQLKELLASADLSFRSVLSGRTVTDTDEAPRIESKLGTLTQTINKLSADGSDYSEVPTEALLEAARGLFAEHKWLEAAHLLDEYGARVGDDWEVHFSRGAAYGNANRGESTTRLALRAYNDAEAFMPKSADLEMRARLLSYRAGMKKRLGLLREAEADLSVAYSLATRQYERDDITYNLAGVYALQGKVERSLELIENLPPNFRDAVRKHRYDYFASLADDPRFRQLVSIDG